jgi:5-methylcytosine-specific restriction endonuclease McrA
MAFSEEVVIRAWSRAGGRCECKRKSHGHFNTGCNKDLVWENRGRAGRGAWEARHKISVASGGTDSLYNCEILCWDCHSQTL